MRAHPPTVRVPLSLSITLLILVCLACAPLVMADTPEDDDWLVLPSYIEAYLGITPTPAPTACPALGGRRTDAFTYQVVKGDTLLDIAIRYDLDTDTLIWANDALLRNPDLLSIGQELVILPTDGIYCIVVQGDTVGEIAERYGVEAEDITAYPGNALEAPYIIYPNDKLIVPGGKQENPPVRVVAYAGPIPTDAKKGTGSLAWPMSGQISQRYWVGHKAIDISGPKGTPIVAADSGFVIHAGWTEVGYGRMVEIDHGNGTRTLYAHLSAIGVAKGQSVAKGATIGRCGASGNATGYHLHFELIDDGVRRNPLGFLP